MYIFCGLLDAMWQTTAYWVMGAMSNNPAKLAHFTGFCKLSFSLIPNVSTETVARQIHPVSWCGGYLAWRCCRTAVRDELRNPLRFRANAHSDRFMNIFISTWVLLVAGLLFALPMIHMRVKNHTEEDEL